MAMNVRGIQRNVKNVVKNYSDAQVKVREATSNDHWGPSSTLMSEIADLTYNVVAFSEIMQMIWKRLNDHGKNWRHVYKALVLLEYLIKTGSEKVAQQCKENIFAIQTLKDFQYIEENKDQGMNVREKSKALVALLKDDEKLKAERTRAMKAKERFAQSVSYASNSSSSETIPKTSASYHESIGGAGLSPSDSRLSSDLEHARPQTLGEEELQLQLALAMSKEEAEQEDRQRKNDDLRLQLAINESAKVAPTPATKKSAIDDLLTLNPPMVHGQPVAAAAAATDPWGAPIASSNGGSGLAASAVPDIFGAVGGISPPMAVAPPQPMQQQDPWSPSPSSNTPTINDPWGAPQPMRTSSANNDPWVPSPPANNTPITSDPWSSCDNQPATSPSLLSSQNGSALSSNGHTATRKTPESFLGPNSNLVNLDALVTTSKPLSSMPLGGNPFAATGVANPFQAAKPPAPTINQLRSQTSFPNSNAAGSVGLGGGLSGLPSADLLGLNFNLPASNATANSQPLMSSGTQPLATGFTAIPGNNPFAM